MQSVSKFSSRELETMTIDKMSGNGKALEILESLRLTGSVTPGDCGADPTILPEWVDMNQLLRAKLVSISFMFLFL